MKTRTILIAVLSLTLVPVALVGACMMLAVGAGIANYRDERNDRARAAQDSRLKRPLVSTSGRILFVAQNDATDDLYVASVDGSGLSRLTQLPHGSLFSRPPRVSPDRSRVAISSAGVWIVPTDRSAGSLRLDRPGGSLAWSPDGQQLASISVDEGGRFHLYVFNADGSGEVRDLAAGWPAPAPGDRQGVDDLTWSPDGKRFAFVYNTWPAYRRSGPRHNHLYFALSDGSGIRNVSLDAGARPVLGGLSWSPDGRHLAFGSGRGVATIDADLKWHEVPVPIHGSRSSQQPSWSPDGTRLAWFSPDSIVISDPWGAHPQELTRGRCRGVHPAWSPDGLRIAFACYEDGSGIIVMNADGSGLTAITDISGGRPPLEFSGGFLPRYPLWLPD